MVNADLPVSKQTRRSLVPQAFFYRLLKQTTKESLLAIMFC